MREHPIPQDITGYQFHIIGSMTLKQFGEILLGVGLAALTYATNLPGIVKWPVIFLFAILGVVAAFIPLEGRPLDHWIITFFKVLYKPTQFFWRREPHVPDVFEFVSHKNTQELLLPELDLSPARRQRIKEYLTSTSVKVPEMTDLTRSEKVHINSVLQIFETQPVISIATQPQTAVAKKPPLKSRVRSMRQTNQVPRIFEQPIDTTTIPELPQETYQEPQFKTTYSATDQVANNIVIPEVAGVQVDRKSDDEEEMLNKQYIRSQDERVFSQDKKEAIVVDEAKDNASFNKKLPFPSKPTEPNKLVGMVLTAAQELVPNAIVEITDLEGNIVRAVKTNQLGQFFITTPLKDGKYLVVAEKDELVFEPKNIQFKGKIMDPLEIRSLDGLVNTQNNH